MRKFRVFFKEVHSHRDIKADFFTIRDGILKFAWFDNEGFSKTVYCFAAGIWAYMEDITNEQS